MAFRSLLFVASIAVAVAGCAAVDPVDSRYDTISRSLAKARNEAIFLNLVRASHDHPLSFVTIANVTPSLNNTTNLGLPNFMFGPASFGTLTPIGPWRDVIFSNETAANTTSVSTNFNVSTQETSAFYEGFLKPIDLRTLAYFIRQGYPHELLFWLFTDAVEVSVGGRTFGTRFNPPSDYGCPPVDRRRRCFGDFVRIAVAAGLTVEEQTLQPPPAGAKPGGAAGPILGKPPTIVFPRFCFSDVLKQQARTAMGEQRWRELITQYFDAPVESFAPRCDTPWDPGEELGKWQPDAFKFHAGPVTFRIVPRSAYGVFEFVGRLIKMQRDNPPVEAYIPPGRADEDVKEPTLWTLRDDRDLVRVALNGPGPCFVHTWFYDGDYCVPESATNTKQIFGLLAQLVAIETAATDLSITPLVRVVP